MAEFLRMNKSNCKNCYKCIRHCPVKAIRFSGNQAHIISEECVLCGECFVLCPQNAKEVVSELETARMLLQSGAPVIASVAPSFVAYYPNVGIAALGNALQAVGFAGAEETAIGATLVKRAYEDLVQAGTQDVILTSCCHAVNLLVTRHYPQLAGCLAPVLTPMEAHGLAIKRRNPAAKVIFIGPCIAKKDEASTNPTHAIDAALTFAELDDLLADAGVAIAAGMDETPESLARLFPTTGGILQTMRRRNPLYTYQAVDGMDACRALLDDIATGAVHHCFVELSACVGSCVGGPIPAKRQQRHSARSFQAVQHYAGAEDFSVTQPPATALARVYAPQAIAAPKPSEAELTAILRKMGKYTAEQELNCGTCGYETCREKAVAIFQGKAEIDMCLPFLMERSERFSNHILDNTPNGILVVNEALEVQQINPNAMKMLRVRSRGDVLGEPVVRILDPISFLQVMRQGTPIREVRSYYAEYDKFLELTVVHDQTAGILIAIFRDVTEEEQQRQSKEAFRRQTIETADQVVDKQMRIVQEIASLLGETAAETKIALTKLKESMPHDDSQ